MGGGGKGGVLACGVCMVHCVLEGGGWDSMVCTEGNGGSKWI